MGEVIHQLDVKYLTFLNNLGTPFFDGFWLAMTNEVTWLPFFVLILLGIYRKFNAETALKVLTYTLLLLAADLIITELVKETVGRVRPNNNRALIHELRILTTPSNYSFFSGHASTSIAVAMFLVLTLRRHFKSIKLLWLWPVFFIYSRIYVGVHYPTDLLAGAAFGILLALVFFKMYQHNFLRRWVKVSGKPSGHHVSEVE